MARQEGPIFLKGTIDGINFYYVNGEPLARKAGGGFTREAIKRSPRMEKVRQSNSEFAACSQINKEFKLAMQPFLKGHKDGTLHSRLMQLFVRIKDQDLQSQPGERTVACGLQSVAGQELAEQFLFTPSMDGLSQFIVFERERLAFTFDVRPELFAPDTASVEILTGLVRFDFDSKAWQRALAEPVRVPIQAAEASELVFPEVPVGAGLLLAVAKVTCFGSGCSEKATDVAIAVHPIWENE